jgi:hypothetical protein
MNPDKQRIAIAEAVKWRPTTDGGICWDENGNAIVTPPDYLKDLNACHEFESKLNNSIDGDKYIRNLLRICRSLIVKNDSLIMNSWTAFSIVNSTASQRCEAFLRTIGKWEDE